MARLSRNQLGAMAAGQTMDASIDQGLRSYMLGVYNYMLVALVVTGAVALVAANLFFANLTGEGPVQLTQLGATVYTTPLKFVVMFAPLIFIFVMSAGINRFSAATAQALFMAFAALVGLSISWIIGFYTVGSIAQTFFISAAAFGALSLWGYTTKRDLAPMQSFMIMGVVGLILASIVNMFLQSSALHFAISVVGVIAFAGLTAADTQQIKLSYYVGDDGSVAKKKSIFGALRLYLDFLNLFLFLLQFMGARR